MIIIEADEQGTLHIPIDVLGEVKPKVRYLVKRVNGTVFLRPEDRRSVWESRTPQERAAAFMDMIEQLGDGPGLPDEALRRESMYP